ncbi:MAG: hypothetical protein IKY53_07710 [Lachnospiraceae bacterium]|nr:hypothetical protein [Lachnospiraceae bacterium]
MEIVLLILAIIELLVIVFLFLKLMKNNRDYNAIVKKGQQIVKGKLNVDDIKVGENKNT